MHIRAKASPRNHGASLILTLIVLSAIVVLFLILSRLITVDSRLSRGYSNVYRAELAADAAAADASNLLLELFKKYPDSLTYWEPGVGGTGGAETPSTPGTVFMYRDQTPNHEYTGSPAVASKIYVRPLISGASTQQLYPNDQSSLTLSAAATADPATGNAKPYIDINEPRRFDRSGEKGWVGTLPTLTTLPGKPDIANKPGTGLQIRVPWVNVLEHPDQPENTQVDPATGQPRNPVVGRYAYWVDDESFKLNVNTASASQRGNSVAEAQPHPSLRALFSTEVAQGIEEVRTKLPVPKDTIQKFVSIYQVGDASNLPSAPQKFGQDYKFLLTTNSSGLNLSRTGARRLNLNQVMDRSLQGLDKNVVYGTAKNGYDLSNPQAATQTKKAVRQIMEAINQNAPEFGQRFYRLQSSNLLTTTNTSTVAAQKNALNVTPVFKQMYVQKIAANIYDYISPNANPTVIDVAGNVLLGQPLHASDIFGDMTQLANGATTLDPNALAAIGKKKVPYFTEYMVHAKMLTRNPTQGAKPDGNGTTISYVDYEVEIDHYFEFWNMTQEDIVPARGDLGPDPYLVLENQPAIRTADDLTRPGDDVPPGRPFEIKLNRPFVHNGTVEDLVFRAGSVTIVTTDPNHASAPYISNWLAGKQVYAAKELYAPGTDQRCDLADFSQPPYPDKAEGTAMAAMGNVRRYRVSNWDGEEDEGYEVQWGPNMEGSTTIKLLLGNRFGMLEAHPSLCMGAQSTNMLVFKDQRYHMFRGSFVGGLAPGQYDPRSSLEAIELYYTGASTNAEGDDLIKRSSMAVLNGQRKETTDPNESHMGLLARQEFPSTRLWNTDPASIEQSAAKSPMIIANKPMRTVGELGNIFDPIRSGEATLQYTKQRRAGGRTLTIGQPDAAWDGYRGSTLTEPELAYQISRSRGWTAWRLADVFTVRDEDEMKDEAKTEVAGLYNPNGLLRDGGYVLRSLLEGIEFDPAEKSDTALQGRTLRTEDTTDLLATDKREALKPTQAGSGGKALANYLAQRLTRQIPKKFSPLWEPGELSQLEFFNPSSNSFIQAGVTNSAINDRGREEVFRRLVDLVTPKGNTFSIFVVGQALNRQGKPTATKARRVTVRLRPVFIEPSDDTFDPDVPAEVNNRFKGPDAYKLEVVAVEDA